MFYLYDNDPDTDNQKLCVGDLPGITWLEMPGVAMQRTAYNHCIAAHAKDTVWCAFLDADEFLHCSYSGAFVNALKNDYDQEGIDALAAHWLLFGSSGLLEYSPEPVTQRFTRRAAETNMHVKSIVRMANTQCMGNDPHSFRVKGMVVNEDFAVLPPDYGTHTPAVSRVWRLNHYHCKSRGEAFERWKTPRADTGQMRQFEEHFAAHDRNDVEDLRIQDVI